MTLDLSTNLAGKIEASTIHQCVYQVIDVYFRVSVVLKILEVEQWQSYINSW